MLDVRRRDLLALLGGALAWPLAARAQQPENPVRIGLLPLGSPSNKYDGSLVEAFRQGLREVGVVENRQVVLDVGWIGSEAELPNAVNELVRRGAKLLVTAGSSASAAAKLRTSSIPIVFVTVGNPVGIGLAESLSRPGGNATGLSDVLADLSGKYVQFASELSEPRATINYLWHSEWPDGRNRFQATERAAQSSGVELRSQAIGDIADANDVMTVMKKSGALTLIVQPAPFTYRHRSRLIDSAMNHGIATIFAWPVAARDGALIAYGPDYAHMYRRAASLVDRILKGTKPADIPVEQPTKFELVINLKTAKTLGLDVPLHLHRLADEVIE
jgi:putative tryptophan/tyrosine transport system substrate-binding protein